VVNNVFEGNGALHRGGAVFASGAVLDLTNNTFVKNSAPEGSGLWLENAAGTFRNNIVFGGLLGQGIHCAEGSIVLRYSDFWDNPGGP